MSPYEERRLNEIERRLALVEESTRDIRVNQNEIRQLWREFEGVNARLTKVSDELKDELSAVRRALYTTALSVAGGVLLGALAILQVFR